MGIGTGSEDKALHVRVIWQYPASPWIVWA